MVHPIAHIHLDTESSFHRFDICPKSVRSDLHAARQELGEIANEQESENAVAESDFPPFVAFVDPISSVAALSVLVFYASA
jgi:hypothetical protein